MVAVSQTHPWVIQEAFSIIHFSGQMTLTIKISLALLI